VIRRIEAIPSGSDTDPESLSFLGGARAWHSADMLLKTARDAADLLSGLFDQAVTERVAVAYLGDDGEVLHVSSSEGGASSADVPVRSIVSEALRRDARGLILAHNHPSGDPRPSAADIAVTRRLAEAGDLIGVRIVDHLIFAGERRGSFRALGLL
jgi:DNA repair protein RadC